MKIGAQWHQLYTASSKHLRIYDLIGILPCFFFFWLLVWICPWNLISNAYFSNCCCFLEYWHEFPKMLLVNVLLMFEWEFWHTTNDIGIWQEWSQCTHCMNWLLQVWVKGMHLCPVTSRCWCGAWILDMCHIMTIMNWNILIIQPFFLVDIIYLIHALLFPQDIKCERFEGDIHGLLSWYCFQKNLDSMLDDYMWVMNFFKLRNSLAFPEENFGDQKELRSEVVFFTFLTMDSVSVSTSGALSSLINQLPEILIKWFA